MKRTAHMILAVLFVFASVFSIGAARALAAAAPSIETVEYKGGGRVQVDFYEDVDYVPRLRVTVKDSSGRSCRSKVLVKDTDELEFKILGYRTGKKYTYSINGIRVRGTSGYFVKKGSVKIPSPVSANRITVKEINYYAKNGVLDIEFRHRVQWKNPKVTVRDSAGRNIAARVSDRDGDDIEAVVKGLKEGAVYQITVSGVKKRGAGSFTTLKKTYRVVYS